MNCRVALAAALVGGDSYIDQSVHDVPIVQSERTRARNIIKLRFVVVTLLYEYSKTHVFLLGLSLLIYKKIGSDDISLRRMATWKSVTKTQSFVSSVIPEYPKGEIFMKTKTSIPSVTQELTLIRPKFASTQFEACEGVLFHGQRY